MDRQVHDLFCEGLWTIFVVDSCAFTSLATDWDAAQTHWLARLPLEIRLMITRCIIPPRALLERSDFLTLSALARTSKAMYLAFQPILIGDIAFPHRDVAGLRTLDLFSTIFVGLITCLCTKPFLIGSVRSIDFTDISTVNKEQLPQFYSQLIYRYVKRLVKSARTRTDHLKIPINKPENQRTPGGYPAQLTALLLLTQASLTRARLTLPRFFWIEDETEASDETEEEPPRTPAGIILRNAPSFPKLTHLALEYPLNANARGSNPRFDPQGDYTLLLAAAPNLQTLILRECNLARLTSIIPDTVTELKLEDCYIVDSKRSPPWSGTAEEIHPFSSPGLSLKSLAITYGKSTITNGNIGNLPEYVSYHHDKAPAPMKVPSQPGWPGQHEARIPLHWKYGTGTKVSHSGQPQQHYFSKGSNTSLGRDAQTTQKILLAAFLSPSPLTESIQHIEIGLGSVIDPGQDPNQQSHWHQNPWYLSAAIQDYFGKYYSRFRYCYTNGEIAKIIHLFPNLKRLTVNCALIMPIHMRYCHGAYDTFLVNLLQPYLSTLETLELTGVNFVGHLFSPPWKTLVRHLTSSSSSTHGVLKNLTLLTDYPETPEIAALVSDKYSIPLKKQGTEVVLLVPDCKVQLAVEAGNVNALPHLNG
ncbi:hypothetical protein QBC37DRAFT_402147 [Rhypophila decipiens]|uniref:Uncharacterized protein n=1 Tax=Rhypophila decipiens TaxID=261697 RepID=A0AAN6Y7Z7_9PEZI|nr:hypothetical protein QBC37DRAFT_402147 [Rhypophila decipiens]